MPQVDMIQSSARGKKSAEDLLAPGAAVGKLFAIRSALEQSALEKELTAKKLASFDQNQALDQQLMQTRIAGEQTRNQIQGLLAPTQQRTAEANAGLAEFSLGRAPQVAKGQDEGAALAQQLAKLQIENENGQIEDRKVKQYREQRLTPLYEEQLTTQIAGAKQTLDLNLRGAARADDELKLREEEISRRKEEATAQMTMQKYDRIRQDFFAAGPRKRAEILELNKGNPLMANLDPTVKEPEAFDVMENNAMNVLRSPVGQYPKSTLDDARHFLNLVQNKKLGIPNDLGDYATPEDINNQNTRNSAAFQNLLNVGNGPGTKVSAQPPSDLPVVNTPEEAKKLAPGTRFWNAELKQVMVVPKRK